jgi:beta-lactamase class D
LFQQAGVVGSFELYDLNNDSYSYYNKERCGQHFIPASTFKIFNSLVALETGVIKDEYEVFKWDSVKRPVTSWNQDQDMKTAFRNSTVWYYQEIARRVGYDKMKSFVEKEHYGNEDISGGIDQFWLTGGLRISQEEQIKFLVKLYKNELNFSSRSMQIVKNIMLNDEKANYKIYGKTGWGYINEINYGWYVGFVEKENNVYFFATNIEEKDPAGEDFPRARIEITRNILKELKIIE